MVDTEADKSAPTAGWGWFVKCDLTVLMGFRNIVLVFQFGPQKG
jgi:hypothetical protein